MALKDLMARLGSMGSVTPVTPHKITGLQPEASVYAACTPVTPVTPQIAETPKPAQNLANPRTKPADPNAWRELAAVYHRHHFKCPTCIASGKGYGLRCGVGAALWQAYADQPG